MLESKKYIFNNEHGGSETVRIRSIAGSRKDESKKLLKHELLSVFRKFGYLAGTMDYEVKIRTTSGNIAWININSIETIK